MPSAIFTCTPFQSGQSTHNCNIQVFPFNSFFPLGKAIVEFSRSQHQRGEILCLYEHPEKVNTLSLKSLQGRHRNFYPDFLPHTASINMEMNASNLTSGETICCLNSVNCKSLSVEDKDMLILLKYA